MLERSGGTVLEQTPVQNLHARHLTVAAKQQELAVWRRLVATGGSAVGSPDPAILSLCEALNAMRGVCTLQSCAGHVRNGYRESGHLWLWLDSDMSSRFDREAFRLAGDPLIERVERRYTRWGQEVTVITFAGDDRGLLRESAAAVVAFFQTLQD